MSVQLSNDDRCVLDLLLERSESPSGTNLCFTLSSGAQLQQRMSHMGHMLNLLDHYRVGEPAPDLVARTLFRCAGEGVAQDTELVQQTAVARSSA